MTKITNHTHEDKAEIEIDGVRVTVEILHRAGAPLIDQQNNKGELLRAAEDVLNTFNHYGWSSEHVKRAVTKLSKAVGKITGAKAVDYVNKHYCDYGS